MAYKLPSLWIARKESKAIDIEFEIHHGRILTGELKWSDRAGNGTTKGREKPIHLNGEYEVNWKLYADFPREKFGFFRIRLDWRRWRD
ncbi:MAG: hypothetical protein R2688_02155 [Fimbriimonadaceae bacterium]